MMFEHLSDKNVIVTGAHRSRTTLAAACVAYDTGHDLVLEEDFGCGHVPSFLTYLAADYGLRVVQAPFLTHLVHELDYWLPQFDYEQWVVMFVHRDVEDVILSQSKARFSDGQKVDFVAVEQGQQTAYHSAGHSAEFKPVVWELQKQRIKHTMDIHADDLAVHPLWRSDRKFSLRQYSDAQPVEVRPQRPLPVEVQQWLG